MAEVLFDSIVSFLNGLLTPQGYIVFFCLVLFIILFAIIGADFVLSLSIAGLPYTFYVIYEQIVIGWALGVIVLIYGFLLASGLYRMWLQR